MTVFKFVLSIFSCVVLIPLLAISWFLLFWMGPEKRRADAREDFEDEEPTKKWTKTNIHVVA